LSQPFDALIPAHTRRQAMDWSLVLASQGIAHLIDHNEATGWTLAVAAADQARALEVLRLYREENRHWRWRRQVFQPGLVFDWASLLWVWLAVSFHVWSVAGAGRSAAGMMTGTALARGEWWRLFTATWLHADLGHLASNVGFGFLFLGLVMGRYGPGVGLLAAYLAGVGGNVAAGWAYEASMRGLGASGVVMGALGLLSVQSPAWFRRRHSPGFRPLALGLMGGMLLFVFLGVSQGSDVVAHFGGFITGLVLGSLLTLAPRFTRRPGINLAAGVLFAILVIVPWWRALIHSGLDG
jgi:membrane associated rhomboid family serine protease